MEVLKKYWWLFLIASLAVLALAAAIFFRANTGDKYYQELYEQQTAKYNSAQVVIDSLQAERESIVKEAVLIKMRADSAVAVANASTNTQTQIKTKYETTIGNIDNWTVEQLDSFFAASTSPKN